MECNLMMEKKERNSDKPQYPTTEHKNRTCRQEHNKRTCRQVIPLANRCSSKYEEQSGGQQYPSPKSLQARGANMDSWIIFFLILFTMSVSLILVGLPDGIGKKKKKIPPGPKALPIIGNLHQLGLIFFEAEPILRKLRAQYGPIFSVRFGPRTANFVAAHDLAHQALVQSGATFAGQPPNAGLARIINRNQHNISSASYGP
ncbi:hypothetical protein EJ110_NYTH18405 [Nymphaea thermarum]|nr:hypothetical protein EJ110_NYTH18405 [Nymphaea thermarum]